MCAGYCGVTLVQVLLAALAMTFGAWVQGAVGFGGSLVASPLLVLVDARLVPGPIGIASILMNVLITRRRIEGNTDHADPVGHVGMIPGTVVAAGVLAILSTRGG